MDPQNLARVKLRGRCQKGKYAFIVVDQRLFAENWDVIRLDLKLLTIHSTVLFMFELNVESLDLMQFGVDEVKLTALKQNLLVALEAKLVEQASTGKKGKDKNAPAPMEGKLEVSQITESLCYLLPDELLKSLAASQIVLDTSCHRKGFVLDIWEKGMFSNLQEILEIGDLVRQEPASKLDVKYFIDIQVRIASYVSTE